MRLDEETLGHWTEYFYGYGSWNAGMWFISHEEGGGDLPEEVAEKFGYFYSAHGSANQATLCDVRDLYRHVTMRQDGPKSGLYASMYEYRFGENALPHSVWKNLIAFAHGYRTTKLPDLMEYQKKIFAARHEALIRLYPLPSPHNHAWYYSWLDMPRFGFLKSRALYQSHVYEDRIGTILHKLNECKPDLVLMYGMVNINVLKKSVLKFYPDAKFRMVKGTKLRIPQHHRAELDRTTLLITTQIPTLRHNRIETGYDWHEFGNSISHQH